MQKIKTKVRAIRKLMNGDFDIRRGGDSASHEETQSRNVKKWREIATIWRKIMCLPSIGRSRTGSGWACKTRILGNGDVHMFMSESLTEIEEARKYAPLFRYISEIPKSEKEWALIERNGIRANGEET